MKKSEFLKATKKSETVFIVYKSSQYRWEDTADPETADVEYHLSEEEAIEAADSIDLELGYRAVVETVHVHMDDLVIFDDDEDYSLDEFADEGQVMDTIHTGETNEGKTLDPNAIVVAYRHHRYMNYAYCIEGVYFVRQTRLQTEADLVNHKDSLMATYHCLVDDLDELAERFEREQYVPFDKMNSGARIIREFLEENGHATN